MSHESTGYRNVYGRNGVFYFRFKDECGKWAERRYGANLKDAVAAQARAQKESDAIRSGLTTRAKIEGEKFRAKRFSPTLDEYTLHLKAKGNTAGHINQCCSRCQTAADALAWNTLNDVDAGQFSVFLDNVITTGRSARMRNDYLVKVAAFLNWCVRPMRYMQANPVDGLATMSTAADPRRPVRALSVEELSRLLHVSGDRSLAYWLAGGVGLRWSEMRKLEWTSIDFARGWMLLPSSIGKNRKETWLPIPSTVLSALRGVKDRGDRICPHPPILRTFKGDCAKAKIEDKTHAGYAHRRSLRKTFITHLAMAKVDLRIAQRLARHSRPELTANIYTDPHLLDMSDAMKKISKLQGPCGTGVAKADSEKRKMFRNKPLREAI